MSTIGGLGSFSSLSMTQGFGSFKAPDFSSLDTDSSGGISIDELSANAPPGQSSEEAKARAEELFSQMDTDSDGSVTSSEKDAYDSKMSDLMQSMQIMAQLAGQDGSASQMAPPPPPPPPGGQGGGISAADILTNADQDSSGSLSLDELTSLISTSSSDSTSTISDEDVSDLFSSMDTDGNGSASEQEIQSFLDNLQQQMGASGMQPPPPPPDMMAQGNSAYGGSSSNYWNAGSTYSISA